ncbi:hypothetical protein Tco_1035432 [Tanacetum coccineum]
MTPAQALTAIQTMADHSQKWHDGMTSRSIRSSSSNDRLAALVNKLDNLGRDMKKLKESVHAIQVGCQICEGPHLNKDCPLNEEVKQIEERQRLEELLVKHQEEPTQRSTEMEGWIKKLLEIAHKDIRDICKIRLKALEARGILVYVNDHLKCLFFMWHSGFQSDIGRADLDSFSRRNPFFITSNNLCFLRIHDSA